MPPETRYAKSGEINIAYQVVGDGPIDLVYTAGIWSNLDVMWEEPRWARYLSRLASFSRLILFDLRGVGLSDRGPEPPVSEVQMDHIIPRAKFQDHREADYMSNLQPVCTPCHRAKTKTDLKVLSRMR